MSPQLCSTALVALNGLQATEDQDAIVSSPMPYSSHTQAFSDLHKATFQCWCNPVKLKIGLKWQIRSIAVLGTEGVGIFTMPYLQTS